MDAFEATYWNLVQTLAWIYCGDRGLIAAAADEGSGSPAERQRRVARLILGHGLGIHSALRQAGEEAGEQGIEELRERYDQHLDYLTYGQAKAALLHALQGGRLKAWGRPQSRGDLDLVPQQHWADLDFFFDVQKGDPYAGPKRSLRRGRANVTHWHGLRFLREEVMAKRDGDQTVRYGAGGPAILVHTVS